MVPMEASSSRPTPPSSWWRPAACAASPTPTIPTTESDLHQGRALSGTRGLILFSNRNQSYPHAGPISAWAQFRGGVGFRPNPKTRSRTAIFWSPQSPNPAKLGPKLPPPPFLLCLRFQKTFKNECNGYNLLFFSWLICNISRGNAAVLICRCGLIWVLAAIPSVFLV